MTKFRISVVISVLLMTVAALAADISVFARDCSRLRESVVRLHIIANSDSQEDQEVKLQVRDLILKETEGRISDAADKQEVEAYFAENSDQLKETVDSFLLGKGFPYGAEISLSRSYFETREYDGNTLPSGDYDSLRIILGDGEGENWWCVMFPPLCISAADGDELPAREYSLMQSGSKPVFRLKLKIVELFRGLKKLFS